MSSMDLGGCDSLSEVLGEGIPQVGSVVPDVPVKTCARCGVTKPVSEFRPQRVGRNGVGGYCIPCVREYNREYYYRNRELINGRRRAYYWENRGHKLKYYREYRRRRRKVESVKPLQEVVATCPDYGRPLASTRIGKWECHDDPGDSASTCEVIYVTFKDAQWRRRDEAPTVSRVVRAARPRRAGELGG